MLSQVLGFQQIQIETVPLEETKVNPASGGWVMHTLGMA